MTDIGRVDPSTLSTVEFARLLDPTAGNAAMDPRTFAELIKHASAEQLDAVLGDPMVRRALLERIFSRMAGQFRPDNAPGRDSAIHWCITGGPGGDEVYETWITGTEGQSTPHCSASSEPSHDPRVTLTMSGEKFLKLVTGNSSPTMMLIEGTLTVDGDIGFATRLAKIFDMPKA